MDYVHFYCENCNSATPEMYNVLTISNITCIEELRQIINSNLITYVGYNFNCKNCANIQNELIDIDNYIIENYARSLLVHNIKLVEEYGVFSIYYSDYYHRMINVNNWTNISKKEFFNSIKAGSLLQIIGSENTIIDKIKEKFYKVSPVQFVHYNRYYLIERPTLTKPARKNNSNN